MNRKIVLRASGKGEGLDLAAEEGPAPRPGPGELVLRVRAASLNYRDLLVRRGQSASSAGEGVIPLSDGAGVVEAVGEGVEGWTPGDRAAGTFFRGWDDGPFDHRYHQAARGGSCDGMLADLVAGPASSFVRPADHLSDAEAACLPCAALTAWHALFERGNLQPGQTVLALGTGGVSVFALQIAAAAGARVVITSRSDEKLARARGLGAWETINYQSTPEWDQAARELTGKRGADHVIEVGGPGTLGRSVNAVASGGSVALIGVLTGFGPAAGSLFPLVTRNADLRGIYVGSRAMFERMNRFISSHGIRPVIDRTFALGELEQAYRYLESGRHFGKVVVTL